MYIGRKPYATEITEYYVVSGVYGVLSGECTIVITRDTSGRITGHSVGFGWSTPALSDQQATDKAVAVYRQAIKAGLFTPSDCLLGPNKALHTELARAFKQEGIDIWAKPIQRA